MWPMIVGLGPLLGEGEIGAFVDADGHRLSWRYQDGKGFCGEGLCAALNQPVYRLQEESIPVAILTSNVTMSSGEAIVVAFRGRSLARSFGQPTAGCSTANEGFELSDGATVHLTVSTLVDQLGRRYGTEIVPDVVVDGEVEQFCAKAIDWLKTCRNAR